MYYIYREITTPLLNLDILYDIAFIRINRHINVCMYVCMYVCMDGWMDGWMDVSQLYLYHTRK